MVKWPKHAVAKHLLITCNQVHLEGKTLVSKDVLAKSKNLCDLQVTKIYFWLIILGTLSEGLQLHSSCLFILYSRQKEPS